MLLVQHHWMLIRLEWGSTEWNPPTELEWHRICTNPLWNVGIMSNKVQMLLKQIAECSGNIEYDFSTRDLYSCAGSRQFIWFVFGCVSE